MDGLLSFEKRGEMEMEMETEEKSISFHNIHTMAFYFISESIDVVYIKQKTSERGTSELLRKEHATS